MQSRSLTNGVLAPVLIVALFLYAGNAVAGAAADERLRNAAADLDFSGVEAALDDGADPNAPSDTARRLTPLGMLALGVAAKGNPETQRMALAIGELLFSKGARLGPFDHGILFFPISSGHIGLVALLLDMGASPTQRIEGFTPPELAIQYKQRALYDLLVSRGGVPVDARIAAQLTLLEAAARGDVAGMVAAVAIGADVNGQDRNGRTALLNAVRTGVYLRDHAETIWWLLSHGADPNRTGESGLRGLEGIPLHIFVYMNGPTMKGQGRPESRALAEETLLRLIKAGAKISGMDSKGRTPLHVAASGDNVSAAQVLIREGARVMARDKEGRTPLDYAESAPMIRLLKAAGARER